MKQLLFILAVVFLGFTACKEKEEEEINPYSIEGTWQVAGGIGTYKDPFTGKDVTEPVFDSVCDYDNMLRFNPNHTLDALTGALSCDSSDTDKLNVANWELNKQKTTLTLSGPGQIPEVYDIWILNQTDLQFSRKETVQGIAFEVILRFKRKQ